MGSNFGFINSLKKQVETLCKNLDRDLKDIEELNLEDSGERVRSKKTISDTMLRITSILQQLIKLKEMDDSDDLCSYEHDIEIINNYLKKFQNKVNE